MGFLAIPVGVGIIIGTVVGAVIGGQYGDRGRHRRWSTSRGPTSSSEQAEELNGLG